MSALHDDFMNFSGMQYDGDITAHIPSPMADTPEPMGPMGIDDVSGRLCELRSYDCRINSVGNYIFLRTGSKEALAYRDPQNVDDQAAIVFTRKFNRHNEVTEARLEIKSPHIKRAFRKVVKSYPKIGIATKAHIIITGTPKVLFHYRNELSAYADTHTNPEVKDHIDLCLGHMATVLYFEMLDYSFSTQMMSSDPLNPWFQHKYLWMVFKPGDLIYHRSDGIESVFRLIEMKPSGHIRLESLEYRKATLGPVQRTVYLHYYSEYKALHDLSSFPLEYHPEKIQIRTRLLNRGRKYVSLLGFNYLAYKRRSPKINSVGSHVSEMVQLQERIVIDYDQLSIKVAGRTNPVSRYIDEEDEFDDSEDAESEDRINSRRFAGSQAELHEQLTEEDFLICTHSIKGFSLTSKRWEDFDVSRIDEISFNTNAFEDLVLTSSKKKLILSLVESQGRETSSFDDLIKGKGQGIIFLLHGPAGVGKTLTADLGHDAVKAEEKLSDALDRAKRWNAIVLLDEADVFMAERTMEHLERNELVSVLLRALDYFQGIMILTTNRVEVIDAAFKSRVHLSVAYPELSLQSRAELWTKFLTRRSAQGKPLWVDESFLEEVSRPRMNGRQIRNAVRVAQGLAARQNRSLTKDDIYTTVETLTGFEEEFNAQLAKRTISDLGDGRTSAGTKRARLDGTAG